jgi:hypothetical protein
MIDSFTHARRIFIRKSPTRAGHTVSYLIETVFDHSHDYSHLYWALVLEFFTRDDLVGRTHAPDGATMSGPDRLVPRITDVKGR